MIKPFQIKLTREEPGGTGVIYSVGSREREGNLEILKKIETYVFVPEGNDVDAYLFDHLKKSGWVK